MALLNYTTTVSAEKTVGEIERLLARKGCKSITKNYDSETPCALSFWIATEFGDFPFVLPVDIQKTLNTLIHQSKKREINLPKNKLTYEHAAKVAWRILKDWIEAQFAFVESGQVNLHQVMLPYLELHNGQSLYELLEARSFALPEVEVMLALPEGRE